MKITVFIIGTVISFSITSCTVKDYSGTYINYNFDYGPFLADIPCVEDTLVLKDDFTFKSGYFGSGSYEIENIGKKKKIILKYNYEMGKGSFETFIEKDGKGNVKIMLFKDQNHYYKKIR